MLKMPGKLDSSFSLLPSAWPEEVQDLSTYLNFSMCLSVVLNGEPLELVLKCFSEVGQQAVKVLSWHFYPTVYMLIAACWLFTTRRKSLYLVAAS